MLACAGGEPDSVGKTHTAGSTAGSRSLRRIKGSSEHAHRGFLLRLDDCWLESGRTGTEMCCALLHMC